MRGCGSGIEGRSGELLDVMLVKEFTEIVAPRKIGQIDARADVQKLDPDDLTMSIKIRQSTLV
jgi:hypothetical protein